ncbi:MerR family transcriptional regulator [Actinokineospora sp. G85]|uniref:MerR family transcriptional regulator n=1 Tax=Actinokineospora sp. G85 TaxID=3406626 RepID=UPI003C7110EB
MTWSIQQVARMAGVTSRTLRHYDEIGLLPPAHVGRNGYRYYGQDEVLRLQRILVLRELGLGLDDIAAIVDDQKDAVAALRAHHERLLAERDRFDRLARTVSRTIADVQRGKTMTNVDHWFEGMIDTARQKELEQEARQRWGDAAVDKVRNTWSKEKGEQWGRAVLAFVAHIDAGRAPEDPAVQETVAGHHEWLSGHWTPNRESYKGLADLYADDPRFRANFDKTDVRLAEYLRTAMKVYADAELD